MNTLIILTKGRNWLMSSITQAMFKGTLMMLLLGLTTLCLAQKSTQTIKGKVIDQDSKQPIIGASILVVNTNPAKGTVTDEQGFF
jgi:hypothetical protein